MECYDATQVRYAWSMIDKWQIFNLLNLLILWSNKMFIHFSQRPLSPFKHALAHPQSKSMCECFPDSLSPTHTNCTQKSNSNWLSAVYTTFEHSKKKMIYDLDNEKFFIKCP